MKRLYPILLLAVITGCASPQTAATTADMAAARVAEPTGRKHPLDESVTQRFVLDNGLRVLMVSDPRFNKSAAAMLVEVGSLDNPVEDQGLAHFLEHMLFLGTEKYPGVDDYGSYLNDNGGYNNAYTAGDHTNYFLEVNHNAFEGSLDRFAQFFIAPLFTEEFTEREMNAVQSEYQKNLENDSRRTYAIQSLFYRPGHPEQMFGTGSLETLGNVTRKELLDFYEAHYSADRMGLILMSNEPVDSLAVWARRYFAQIENRDIPQPRYPSDYLVDKPTFRLIQIEPVKDIRTLELEFDLPGYADTYLSKPGEMLMSLIGHEGAGSLLSLLKKENLATGLSASSYLATLDYGALSIRVELTPEGLTAYRDVVKLCLSYIDMLQASDYPAYHFQEQRTMAALNEIYSDKGEGAGAVSRHAGNLVKYPLAIVDRVSYLYGDEDPAPYHHLLSHLRPDNMLVTLTAKGVPTTDTETHYGAQYSYSEDAAFYQELTRLPSRPELGLPEANPFIPAAASIPVRAQSDDVVPLRVIDEPGLTLYHSLDTRFLRPKASLQYKFRFPLERMDLRFKVLLDMYTTCVNESLNELAYPARLAGLSYSFANGYEGVYFNINGYGGSTEKLFEHVLDHMQNIRISEETFAAIKDRTLRSLENFSRQDAWRIVRARNYELLQAESYREETRLPIVAALTLDEIHAFSQTLYEKVFIEALVHGDLPVGRAVALTRKMVDTIGASPIPVAATFSQGYLQQPLQESILYTEQLEVNNSAFRRDYYLGETTPHTRALTALLNPFLYQPFFTEMRTRQQLGYIVAAGAASLNPDQAFLYFIIQSATHTAADVEQLASEFIATLPATFDAITEEAFTDLKAAAIEELRRKEKTIAEKAATLNALAFTQEANFAHKQETIAALEALTREQVSAALTTALSGQTSRSRTILGFASQHEMDDRLAATAIADVAAWKQTRTYR